MICPLKFNTNTLTGGNVINTCPCEREECAWWSEYFARCSKSVGAYQKGLEDHEKETKIYMSDRH